MPYEDYIVTYVDNFKMVVLDFWSNWILGIWNFCGGRKNRRARRKTLEARERTSKQLYSHSNWSFFIRLYMDR
jgi:hypothetical protein